MKYVLQQWACIFGKKGRTCRSDSDHHFEFACSQLNIWLGTRQHEVQQNAKGVYICFVVPTSFMTFTLPKFWSYIRRGSSNGRGSSIRGQNIFGKAKITELDSMGLCEQQIFALDVAVRDTFGV
jgi:hypothetical protein